MQLEVIKLLVALHNHFANASKMVRTAYIKIYSRILALLLIHNPSKPASVHRYLILHMLQAPLHHMIQMHLNSAQFMKNVFEQKRTKL